MSFPNPSDPGFTGEYTDPLTNISWLWDDPRWVPAGGGSGGGGGGGGGPPVDLSGLVKADGTVPMTAPLTVPAASLTTQAANLGQVNGLIAAIPPTDLSGLVRADGTVPMTAPLTLPAASLTTQAVNLGQLNALLANYLPLSGGTLASLTVTGNAQVGGNILALGDITITGATHLSGNATQPNEAVTLSQMTAAINTAITGGGSAPDMSIYLTQAQLNTALAGVVPLSGNVSILGPLTMSGQLTLPASDATGNQAVRFNQMDAAIASAVAGMVPIAGSATSVTTPLSLASVLTLPAIDATGNQAVRFAQMNAAITSAVSGSLPIGGSATTVTTPLSLTSPLTLPATNATGNQAVRFDQMQAAINAIALTPGPKGDPGTPGLPGGQGSPGIGMLNWQNGEQSTGLTAFGSPVYQWSGAYGSQSITSGYNTVINLPFTPVFVLECLVYLNDAYGWFPIPHFDISGSTPINLANWRIAGSQLLINGSGTYFGTLIITIKYTR